MQTAFAIADRANDLLCFWRAAANRP